MRTGVQDPADVAARERIFQTGSGRERIHHGFWKFFGENACEAGAELLAGDASGGARRIGAQKFQPAGLGAAETLDFQDDAIVRILLYAQDAAGEIAFVGPEMQEWTFTFDAPLEMQSGEFGEPCAVVADFEAAGRRPIAVRAIQGSSIVRTRIQLHTIMEFLGRLEKLRAAIAKLGQ